MAWLNRDEIYSPALSFRSACHRCAARRRALPTRNKITRNKITKIDLSTLRGSKFFKNSDEANFSEIFFGAILYHKKFTLYPPG